MGTEPGDERTIFTSVFRSCNIALVKPLELLGQTVSPDGSVMKLIPRGDEYLILVNGAILMSNRMHGSEEALPTSAFHRIRTLARPSVLLGGSRVGFILPPTLHLPPSD